MKNTALEIEFAKEHSGKQRQTVAEGMNELRVAETKMVDQYLRWRAKGFAKLIAEADSNSSNTYFLIF